MNILIGTAVLAVLAAWFAHKLGPARQPDALEAAKETLLFTLPRICVAMIGASFFAELLPDDQIQALFGAGAGFRALLLAAALGVITPGGAFVSFAVGAAALSAGASIPAVLAYVVSWGLFSLTRSLTYEVPITGRAFYLRRVMICWPIPLIVGAAATAILRV